MTNQRNETPEPLAGAAYLVTNLSSGEPSICFEDERGDYGDEDHMPVFDALVRLSDATAALQAKDAEIARLKAALDDASTLFKRTPRVCMEMYNHGDRTSFGFQAKMMVRAIDAMKGEAA